MRHQYRDKLVKALMGDADKMNLSRYDGKKTDVDKVIEMAETMPFFAERRVIEITESELLKSGGEKLAEYLERVNETTYFVFDETKIEKRGKLYKTIAEKGYVTEFEKPGEADLRRWIVNMAASASLKIEPSVAALILGRCGDDMYLLKNETEKCISYCMDRGVITREDVMAICTRQLEDRIFDMVDMVAAGKKEKAMKIYYDLLACKEKPAGILARLSSHFRNLYAVKQMREKGLDKRSISEKLGIGEYPVQKCLTQISYFKEETLRNAMEEAAQSEQDFKSGKMSDYVALELFMIKYAS